MVTGQILRQINFSINIVAFILGISVNILLIFLLLRTKIPELKNYNRLIFQIAVIDIINSIITVNTMVIGIVIEGREFLFQNSFFRFTPQPLNHIIMLIWQFSHFFSLSVVPVQFVYRYLILCKDKTITNSLYACLFFVPFLISSFQIFVAHFTTYPNLNLKEEILQELSQYFQDCHEMLIGNGGEHTLKETAIFNLSSTTILIISYMVTYYCGYKIKAHFKASTHNFTAKTLQMQQSLNKALTPIIFLILPSSVFLVFGLTKQTTKPIYNIFLTATSWPPFVNATFALITLKPLQRKFIRYFKNSSN